MNTEVTHKRFLMGSVPCGSDLLEAFTRVCEQERILLGRIEAIGAVQKAAFGYYDQKNRRYRTIEKNGEFEILSCIGNISICDGVPMVHAHITFADEMGSACGGHLVSGTVVFAGEFSIQELQGAALVREYEEKTGLKLWRQ